MNICPRVVSHGFPCEANHVGNMWVRLRTAFLSSHAIAISSYFGLGPYSILSLLIASVPFPADDHFYPTNAEVHFRDFQATLEKESQDCVCTRLWMRRMSRLAASLGARPFRDRLATWRSGEVVEASDAFVTATKS